MLKIERIERGRGPCSDCRPGARFRITWGDGSRRVILCPRCSAYLASTLLARIDEMRHEDQGEK
jgi:hypothetical protein